MIGWFGRSRVGGFRVVRRRAEEVRQPRASGIAMRRKDWSLHRLGRGRLSCAEGLGRGEKPIRVPSSARCGPWDEGGRSLRRSLERSCRTIGSAAME